MLEDEDMSRILGTNSPRHRAGPGFASFDDTRAMSPTMRVHPKARRSLDVGAPHLDGEVPDHFGGASFGHLHGVLRDGPHGHA